jgi:hypothetical protein
MRNTLKKTIRTTFTLVVLASTIVFVPSCKKSFLEEPPRAQTPADYFSSTTQAAEELVNSVYNKLYDWSQHSFSWIGITSIASDDGDKGSDPGDTGADKDQMDNLSWSSTSLSFGEVWESNYEGISRANKAVDMMDRLDMDPTKREIFKGEVRFLRAYYYFNLVRCFGGVPKIDKVPVTQAEIDAVNVRASEDEIYNLIESDLNFAAGVLPTQQLIETGRATSYAATGLLSKVSLYRQKWSQAAATAEVLIGSGKFGLLDDYSHVWREVGEFSKESIYEVNCKGTDPAKGLVGYFVVQAPRGQGGLGWGFNTPTQDLYNAYEAGDVRRDATIIVSGQTLWDGWVTNIAAPNKRYNYKSYVSKFMESWGKQDNETNKNLRILRYGDLLLVAAEAYNELNDTSKALKYLNMVRTRAGLANATATTQADIRTAIWKERRVEMAMEHDRVFDLRRTKQAGSVMRAHGKAYVDGKHDLYPIPQRQIDLANGKLIQNPGY